MIHPIAQGSPEWHQLRAQYFTASDAAAMMGESKYKSRNQLLHEKKTGIVPSVNPAQQAIFDKGHAAEAAAREILELEQLENFSPVVGSIEIDGLKLLASLDGLTDDGKVIFEHKLFNVTLAANVDNGVLEPTYTYQLEQQLLVSGAEGVIFVVSDGTPSKWHEMNYKSLSEVREKLIAGWKQFAIDLESYEPEAKAELVIGADAEDFPLITYEIQGSSITSNINLILPAIQERAELEMSRVLDTDQDFADKEKLNKATKVARDSLKDVVARAKGEFVSFSEFSEVAAKIDVVLQKMQSQGEKQVKQAKEAKKQSIQMAAANNLLTYIDECKGKITPLSLTAIMGDLTPDWAGAMKGKRNLESIQNAVDGVIAQAKIEINQSMARIVPNQIFLKEHATEYSFLLSDVQQIINQEIESFQAVVKSRIADHKEAESKRIAVERERIRQEEEAKVRAEAAAIERKAEQSRIDEERSRIEGEREQIRKEQETAHIADASKMEPPVDRLADAGKVIPDERKTSSVIADIPSFAEDMASWASEYSISFEATQKLSEILQRHSVPQAA